jgi:hypothetical protein
MIVAKIFGLLLTFSLIGAAAASVMLPYYVDPERRHFGLAPFSRTVIRGDLV